MMIQASSVAMSSERSYSKTESSMSMTVTSKAEDAVKVDISDKSRSLFKQLQEGLEEKERAKKEEDAAKKEKQKQAFLRMTERSQKAGGERNMPVRSEEEMELEMLRRILESLRRHRKGEHFRDTKQSGLLVPFGPVEEKRGVSAGMQVNVSRSMGSMSIEGGSVRSVVSAGSGTGREYKIQTVTSSFFAEQEVTEFSTTGTVRTADGREITFGVSAEMSRSFAQSMEIYTEGSYVLKDPLVINLDADIAEVSDKKFYFDLDGDGEEEEISELGSGSGYLAVDKNGDGIINDGSELFGTKNGDGFAELAAYDSDGNGWIDEADEIFSRLKVWVKDENGENRLLDLKEADVGAIYLGNVDTRFSLNNAESNAVNGVIQKTGVYLREDGTAGTVQHVDLAV